MNKEPDYDSEINKLGVQIELMHKEINSKIEEIIKASLKAGSLKLSKALAEEYNKQQKEGENNDRK